MRAHIVDTGTGSPIIVIPGIQGRWEWMRAGVDALATRFRTVSYSLAGEPGSGPSFDLAAGMDGLIGQLEDVITRSGPATLCGVSFGGLIALRYAASRPDQVQALVLVSTPGPDWTVPSRADALMAHPRLLAPVFAVGAIGRSWRELSGTFPTLAERIRCAARCARPVLTAPASLVRMRDRVELAIAAARQAPAACARIAVPTLVVTGDPRLDTIVAPASTRSYARLIPGAQSATLAGAGHLGLVTRPERFAALVGDFVAGRSEGDLRNTPSPGEDIP